MEEIKNGKDLHDYLLDSIKKQDIVVNTEPTGMPFVLVNNLSEVKVKDKTMKQGDKFVLYSDGTVELMQSDKVANLQKTELTKKELSTPDSAKFGVAVLSNKSPNVNVLHYEMKRSGVEFASAQFTNQRTGEQYTRFTYPKNKVDVIGAINQSIKAFGKKPTDKPAPALESDVYKLDSATFEKSENRYKVELQKIPEQALNRAVQLKKQIEDSVRKCEVFLGQMKEAQLSSNKKSYDKAKGELEKEFRKVKQSYEALVMENPQGTLFDKAIALQQMQQMEEQVKSTNMFQMGEPDKLKEKITKSVRESYFIIHLNHMLEIRENLSKQEQIDTMSALNGATAHDYGKQTKAAYQGGNAKESHDTVLSDVRSDGAYGTNYGEAGTANTTQKPAIEEKKSFMDNINAMIEEEYEEDTRYTERTLFNN